MSCPREAARSSEPIMDFQQPFSVLNERLRPRVSASEQVFLSLNRLEDRQLSSFRSKSSPYQTVLPEQQVSGNHVGPEINVDQVDGLSCDDPEEADFDDLVNGNMCLITEMKIKDFDEDSISSKSDEKDTSGELSSEGGPGTPENEGLFQRGYAERSLPDLIKSGRPLGRRRTVGHVSQTLKEVRREVELSRRRSIKLKAQVDKLQERRDGPGWSQDRERVTEEVLSVLRLLFPLTEASFNHLESSNGENRLDGALNQLQKVARNLAVSHTAKQEFRSGKDGSEESAILQQALRDRDEAIEKKKAMEAELLRSRTEMMVLNNQVLEAAQKRLEMSLELEAWKEDFQLLLHQQVQSQQLAEQNQKKSSRGLGLLRRNRPPVQRPPAFPLQSPSPTQTRSSRMAASTAAPATPKSPVSAGGTWRDRLRRGKPSRLVDQDAAGNESDYSRDGDGFQVVSLD